MKSGEQALKQAVKVLKKSVFSPRVPVKTLRHNYDTIFGTPRLPNNMDRKVVTIGPVEADLFEPELALEQRTILYAHGGGFVAGSRYASANLCASLAHESAARLLLPDYRLAPEYPFPTALEDLYQCYSWMLKEGIPHDEIVFAGDGAGANLVISLVHYLESKSVRLPGAVIALSPWIDLSCTSPVFMSRKNPDPLYTRDVFCQLALQYTYQGNFGNQNVSPIHGDFSRFPPLYIQCGTRELLLDDARRLAEKVQHAARPVVLDVVDNMWHLFQAIDTLTPEAQHAVRRVGAWVRQLFK
ncbi:MAG TPA: alpha/beta hydrolase [Treponemataceae bacterium]|jgi:acetyl esterase/lipase|nr:alpha/beta hydrolase [Treponemataceae bacterium]HOS35842.1 alpha/beta hydrolase [Treponemataceae bacterium]